MFPFFSFLHAKFMFTSVVRKEQLTGLKKLPDSDCWKPIPLLNKLINNSYGIILSRFLTKPLSKINEVDIFIFWKCSCKGNLVYDKCMPPLHYIGPSWVLIRKDSFLIEYCTEKPARTWSFLSFLNLFLLQHVLINEHPRSSMTSLYAQEI